MLPLPCRSTTSNSPTMSPVESFEMTVCAKCVVNYLSDKICHHHFSPSTTHNSIVIMCLSSYTPQYSGQFAQSVTVDHETRWPDSGIDTSTCRSAGPQTTVCVCRRWRGGPAQVTDGPALGLRTGTVSPHRPNSRLCGDGGSLCSRSTPPPHSIITAATHIIHQLAVRWRRRCCIHYFGFSIFSGWLSKDYRAAAETALVRRSWLTRRAAPPHRRRCVTLATFADSGATIGPGAPQLPRRVIASLIADKLNFTVSYPADSFETGMLFMRSCHDCRQSQSVLSCRCYVN